MAEDGELRIDMHEREETLSALAEHHEAGRLDAFEYEDRRGRATDAITRHDVEVLFTDLPEPRPGFLTHGVASGRPAGAPARPLPARRQGGRLGRTLMSLAPFIAIAVFFMTRSWLAFLLIPVIAIIGKALDED